MTAVAKFLTHSPRPDMWSVRLSPNDTVSTVVSRRLINESSRKIKVFHKNGMLETLKPARNSNKDELIVREVRTLPYREISVNIEEIKRRLENNDSLFGVNISKVEELFRLVENNKSALALEFTIDYSYDLSLGLDTVGENGEVLAPCHILGDMAIVDGDYDGELDLSLIDGLNLDIARAKGLHSTDNLSGINYEIVDNNHLLEKRFVVLANKSVQITPIRNTLKEDGLYVTVSKTNKVMENIFLPLKDKDKWEELGVYEKEESAIAFYESGTKLATMSTAELAERERKLETLREENRAAELKHKAAIEKLEAELRASTNKTDAEERKLQAELELEKLKMKYNKEKLKNDEEALTREKEYERLKSKMEKLKLKRADKHHSRSVERENTITISKTVAAVTVAVITIAVAVVKWVSTSSFAFW